MTIEIDPELHTIPPDRGDMAEQPKWRARFPDRLAQDAYVARRDFTKFLGLTSLAFVIGQFWIGMQNTWRKRRGSLPIVEIARIDDIPREWLSRFQLSNCDRPGSARTTRRR